MFLKHWIQRTSHPILDDKMQFRVGTALLLWMLISFPSRADVYQPEVALGPWAGDLKIEPGMVAKGYRLWGSEIVGQDLSNAKFDDCDLTGVALRQCNLRGATFKRALMTGLVVDDCDWGRNDFSDAVVNGIKYAYMDDQWEAMGMSAKQFQATWSYKNRDLRDCAVPSNLDGTEYDFTDFLLNRVYFFRVSKSRFTRSRIADATFQYCDLSGCIFNDAILFGNRFSNCKVDLKAWEYAATFTYTEVQFVGVEFSTSIDYSNKNLLGGVLKSDANVQANFENSKINDFGVTRLLDRTNIHVTQSYKNGNLSKVRISKSNLSGTDFSHQLLAESKFWKCDFTDCKFDDAVITGISFKDCTGLTREQIESTWNFKHHRMTGIELPEELLR